MIKFNGKKFEEMVHYVIHKCTNLENVGKTVLYKLLYFSDFDYYEKYEISITGESYRKLLYGPAPCHINKVLKKLKKKSKIKEIKTKYKGYPQNKFLSIQEPEIVLLSGADIQIIDKTINKFSGMTAHQITGYSHTDIPWKATKNKEIIDYELVFYRDAIHSVTEENDIR